jgi:RNA polymerase sigma factor (sigma-70 family)
LNPCHKHPPPGVYTLEVTDEELMQAYQQGGENSARAFESLYERYSAQIYGFLTRRLVDQRMVEDVFQATFLKLHQTRHQYDAAYPFAPWLFTVCRSALLDAVRKNQRREALRVDTDPDSLAAVAPSALFARESSKEKAHE